MCYIEKRIKLINVKSRQRFCVIDAEYSNSDAKWNYRGVALMQKRLPQIQVLPKQQSLLKIKKVCSLAWNKHAKWLSFQTTSLWVAFVSGLSHCTERDWSVLFDVLHMLICQSIHALFVKFVLFLYSLWNNKKSTKKGWIRMAVKLMVVWMMSVVQSFQYHSLTQNSI